MKQLIIFCVVIFVSVFSAGKSTTSDVIVIFATLGITTSLLFFDKKLFKLDVSKKILLTFILIHLWALSFSVTQPISFLTSYQTWAYLGIVYLFSFAVSFYLSTSKLRSRFVDGLVLFAGTISLATAFYYISGMKPPQGDLSIFFPTYGHNRLAEFFLPITPFSIFILMDKKRPKLIRSAALISIINLFLSFSRTSLISLLFFPLVAVITNLRTDKKIQKWISAIALIALTMFALFTPIWLTSKGIKSDIHPLLLILDKPFSSKERIVFFIDALSKWSRKMVHGYGPGTYQYTATNPWANDLSTIFVHNHILQSLYEGGLLGLFAEVCLLIWAIVSARRSCRDIKDRLLLSGVLLSLIQAQLDFGWEIPAVYLINLIILFSLCRDPEKNSLLSDSKFSKIIATSLLVFSLSFSLLSFWSVFPWTSSTQGFQKLITSSWEKGDEQLEQKILDNWLRLEGGNGEVYKWLYQFNLRNGDFKKSFNNFIELEKTVYLRNSFSVNDLTQLIDETSLRPDTLSGEERFMLLNIISRNYKPHDFFWLPVNLQMTVYSIIDSIPLSSTPPFLSDSQLAELHYWRYTQMLTEGKTNYDFYQQFIDTALSLNPSNQLYNLISEINKALVKSNEVTLLQFLKQPLQPISTQEKPTILLSLRDHINMKLGDIYMKKNNFVDEIKYRREALKGTQTAVAYIQLAKRLNQLNQEDAAASILKECIKLYPDCRVWYEKSL